MSYDRDLRLRAIKYTEEQGFSMKELLCDNSQTDGFLIEPERIL